MAQPKSKLPVILKRLLKERDMSARQLARDTGLAQSTVSSFLAGRKQHRPEQLLMVAKYFGVSLEYLLFGIDSRPPTLEEVLTEEIWDGWVKIKVERAVPTKRKGEEPDD